MSADLEASTNANTGHLGCAYLNGLIYTTSRGNGATTTAPHTINVWTPTGTWVLEFSQPASTNGSAWGYRDGDSDGVSLIFGYEDGIEVIDTFGNPVNQLIADNGPQTITQPIVSTGALNGDTHRGIAYDPSGNGGNGSIFTANFDTDIEEIALDGTLLHTYPLLPEEWSVYGLAIDTGSDTLWISSTPANAYVAEYTIDRTIPALTPTGRKFLRGQPASTQGGLDFVEGGLDGRNCGSDLIGVDQGAPDTLYGYRLDLYDGYTSDNEPMLAAGFDGGNNGTDVVVPLTATTIEWTGTGGLPGLPGILVVDINQLAPLPPGITGIMELWELSTLGVAQVGINDGTPLSIPAAGFVAAGSGSTFNSQAVMLNTSLPSGICGLGGLPVALTTSNPVRHVVETPFKAEVRATGTNSFNDNTASGFFQIEAGSLSNGDPIVSVEFDWVNSTNTGQATMEFDCDQTGMANTFMEGNGGGCGGTYRNMSDVTCGLDYANAANNLLNTTTCAGSVVHCEASNPVTAPDYRTLKWHFVPGMFTGGKVFEFDIDTDGGQGVSGQDMEGMVVTITCASGAVLTGELSIDLSTPNQSVIRF